MHESKSESPLKTPVAVYILGALFLLAPFSNYVLALFNRGIPEWYWPATWWDYASRIAVASWIWSALLTTAGVALLIPRKSSWAVAIFVLLYTIVYNLASPDLAKGAIPHSKWIFAATTFSVLMVLYFFRFPYLDRRDRWWGVAKRYDTHFSVTIAETGATVAVANLSRSGALLRFGWESSLPRIQSALTCILPNQDKLLTTVVRTDDRSCGVTFKKLSRRRLKKLLKLGHPKR